MTTHDVLALLSADHRRAEHLFAAYEALVAKGAAPGARAALACSICDALTAHATAEEELFYPAAGAMLGANGLMDTLMGAHDEARVLIESLERLDAADARFDALVMRLSHAVGAHVRQEEGELFAQLHAIKLGVPALAGDLVHRRDEVLRLLGGGRG